ncbi:hypothetical protein MPLB_1080078 [Mesorhizobium sp. ORS 3324]|nr:hypothetical protein MPLB_1080078 [Mesorhizobium sp. ORS 3324]
MQGNVPAKSQHSQIEIVQILYLFYRRFTQYLLRVFASNKSQRGTVSIKRGDYHNENDEGQAVALGNGDAAFRLGNGKRGTGVHAHGWADHPAGRPL